jgi:hypothetical protein
MSNRVRKGYGAKEGRWGADKMDGGERHLDRVVYGGQSMSQIHRHDVGSISPDHFKSAHLKNSRCEQRNEPIAYEILISLCCRLLISVHFILRPAAVCSDVPLCIFGFFFLPPPILIGKAYYSTKYDISTTGHDITIPPSRAPPSCTKSTPSTWQSN